MEKKIEYPCPCGGKVKWKKEKVIQMGVDCGVLNVEVCDKCGDKYLPEESMAVVEEKLKEKGLWGVDRKEIKFWKSGNSVVLRLPTKLSQEFGLDKIKKGFIHQEGRHKFVVEY